MTTKSQFAGSGRNPLRKTSRKAARPPPPLKRPSVRRVDSSSWDQRPPPTDGRKCVNRTGTITRRRGIDPVRRRSDLWKNQWVGKKQVGRLAQASQVRTLFPFQWMQFLLGPKWPTPKYCGQSAWRVWCFRGLCFTVADNAHCGF